MKINSRLLKIINFLNQNNSTNIKTIARSLDISERAVRYEIDNLNFILEMNGIPEVEKLPMGAIKVSENFFDAKHITFLNNIVKESKKERSDFVKFLFLMENSINISQTARKLNISRATVKNDLLELEEEFRTNNITVENQNIISSEKITRDYLLKCFSKDINMLNYSTSNKNELIYVYLSEKTDTAHILAIKKFIHQITKIFNNTDNNFYEFIFSYIVISILRIREKRELYYIKNKNFLENIEEYRIITEQLTFLENSLNIKFSKVEKLQLTDYILGFVSYSYNTSVLENWIEIEIFVKDLIALVNSSIDYDILHDEQLAEGLLNHMKPLIYRLRNNFSINSDIYIKAVEEHFNIFYLIKKSLSKFNSIIYKEISDSEIALLTLHFLASIERNKNKGDNYCKTILLVCYGGYGTSMLVKNNLEQNYHIKIKNVISYFQLANYDLSNIDYIISTIKLKNKLMYPKKPKIIEITPFFSIEDQKILEENCILKRKSNETKVSVKEIVKIVKRYATINNPENLNHELAKILNIKNFYPAKVNEFMDFISPDKIQYIESVKDWKESIRIAGARLLESDYINNSYIEEIIGITETFGAYYVLGNKIAIPHGQLAKNVYKNGISVLFIKEPVIFPNNKSVSLIFFMAALKKNDHLKSLASLLELAKNKEFLLEMEKINNNIELFDLIEQYSE
jgi:mannitol operon transcriptional antiterminator